MNFKPSTQFIETNDFVQTFEQSIEWISNALEQTVPLFSMVEEDYILITTGFITNKQLKYAYTIYDDCNKKIAVDFYEMPHEQRHSTSGIELSIKINNGVIHDVAFTIYPPNKGCVTATFHQTSEGMEVVATTTINKQAETIKNKHFKNAFDERMKFLFKPVS